MIRLTKSFSSGGASPTSEPSCCSPRTSGVARLLDDRTRCSSCPGPRNTTTSPGPRVGEPVGDLVDQHAVVVAAGAAVQRGLHRPGRDDVDLGEERLDQERQHQRDHDEQRQLLPERRPPCAVRAAACVRRPGPLLVPAGGCRSGDAARAAAVAARRPVGSPPSRTGRRGRRWRSSIGGTGAHAVVPCGRAGSARRRRRVAAVGSARTVRAVRGGRPRRLPRSATRGTAAARRAAGPFGGVRALTRRDRSPGLGAVTGCDRR